MDNKPKELNIPRHIYSKSESIRWLKSLSAEQLVQFIKANPMTKQATWALEILTERCKNLRISDQKRINRMLARLALERQVKDEQ